MSFMAGYILGQTTAETDCKPKIIYKPATIDIEAKMCEVSSNPYQCYKELSNNPYKEILFAEILVIVTILIGFIIVKFFTK